MVDLSAVDRAIKRSEDDLKHLLELKISFNELAINAYIETDSFFCNNTFEILELQTENTELKKQLENLK